MVYIDLDAAAIETAASEHAREVASPRTTPRNALAPMRPSEFAAHLEAAFIAGACYAKRDTVRATDALLERVRP